MVDELTYFKVGLQCLLQQLKDKGIGKNHPIYKEAVDFQSRLLANLRATRRYGDNETRQTDRNEVIGYLNELALNEIDISFNDLCEICNNPSPPTPPELPSNDFLISAHIYITAVQNIIKKAYNLFSKGEKLWKTDCEAISDSFQEINKAEPFDNPTYNPSIDSSLNSLEIKLDNLDIHLRKLMQIINAFCPHCRSSSNRVKIQQQEISRQLKSFLDKDLKEATALMSTCVEQVTKLQVKIQVIEADADKLQSHPLFPAISQNAETLSGDKSTLGRKGAEHME